MIKMRLISDFVDYYDHHFDVTSDAFFIRKSRSGMNRRQMFKYMDDYVASLATMFKGKLYPDPWEAVVPHGTVGELFEKYCKDMDAEGKRDRDFSFYDYHTGSEFVVYTDEDAHRGEGKIIIDADESDKDSENIKKYWNNYASFFLRNYRQIPCSNRKLFVGKYVFNLEYISLTDEWRSNCGVVSIILRSFYIRKKKTVCDYALCALDSVTTYINGSDDYFPQRYNCYVDFNIAPQIPKTVVIPDGTCSCTRLYRDMNDEEKEISERIKKLQGQEVEFKEILPAKEAADSIKNYLLK